MYDKLDDEFFNNILQLFSGCSENCEYHKHLNDLNNKDAAIKALQNILKVLIYHNQKDVELLLEFRSFILILLTILSNQSSLFDAMNWYIDALKEVNEQKIN